MRLHNRLVLSLGLVLGLSLSTTALGPAALADESQGPSPASPSGSGASPSTASPATSPTAATATAPTTAGSTRPSGSPTSAPGTAGAGARSAGRATTDDTLVTVLDTTPSNPSTSVTGAFTFHSVIPGVRFLCTLAGPGQGTAPAPAVCPAGGTGASSGSATYPGLAPDYDPYTFSVQAFTGADSSNPETTGPVVTYKWRIFSSYVRDRYVPAEGASFNHPRGTVTSRRTNLTRVVRTINSMPGYKQAYQPGSPSACPTSESAATGQIRMSMYSLTDRRVASALISAHRRCVSVQVLMNDHLDRTTDDAWKALEDALRTPVYSGGQPRRSFAHRCHSGCVGGGVLHTKMVLFDSRYPVDSVNKIHKTVMFGSSNMTANAAQIQYNDLYAAKNQPELYDQFSAMYEKMKKDDGYHRNGTWPATSNGIYSAVFWPRPFGATDPYRTALSQVRCTGATGGTGINGRTVVYINMHAWFGTRGLSLANQVKTLYNRGCYVRVLYSFMSYGVFKKLHAGTGSRMSVRRTLFSRDGRIAYVYSHFKNISISGVFGGDTSSKLVYTGSNNFTNEGLNFDEVTVRIKRASAYDSYVRAFKYNSAFQSSAVYASFSEPTGGGRAPATPKPVAGRGALPAGTPVITSPDVRVGADGRARVLD